MLLAVQFASPVVGLKQESVSYFEVADQAIFNCPAYKNNLTKVKPSVVFDLVGIERKFKVPSDLRGMLLAHACTHGSLSGDITNLRYWKSTSPSTKAKTIFDITGRQKLTRFNRFHFQRTADIWMRRVVDNLNKGKNNRCKRDDESCNWIKAWFNSAKKYKKTPKKEVKLLRNWHKNIKKIRRLKKYAACDC